MLFSPEGLFLCSTYDYDNNNEQWLCTHSETIERSYKNVKSFLIGKFIGQNCIMFMVTIFGFISCSVLFQLALTAIVFRVSSWRVLSPLCLAWPLVTVVLREKDFSFCRNAKSMWFLTVY